MNGKIFFTSAAIFALLLIALSFVWPQGLATRSPAPFGHAIELPDYYRMVKERDARQKHEAETKARERANAAAASSVSASLSDDSVSSSESAASLRGPAGAPAPTPAK